MAASADITFVKLSAEAAHSIASGTVSFASIQATEILLDAYPINQYFTHAFAFSEATVVSVSKVFLDSFGLSEAQIFELQKNVADTLTLSEVVSVALIINRAHTDSVSVADVTVLAVNKVFAEAINFSEVAVLEFQANKSDAVTLSETQIFAVETAPTESVSVLDTLTSTTNYVRTFSDAFSLDDLFAGGRIITEDKTNIVSLSDSFSYSLIIGNNAVLNASTLNTFTLNR